MRVNTPRLTILKYDGENATYKYIGEAPIGTAVTSPFWRIYRIENSGADSLTRSWADNSDKYDKVWNDRTSYTY